MHGGFLAETSIQIAMSSNTTILEKILQLHATMTLFQFSVKTSD